MIKVDHSKIKMAMMLGPVWFGVIVFVAGAFTQGYSQSTQAISELGIRGAPCELLVRFGGFVPLGLLVTLFAFDARKWLKDGPSQTTALLIICTGIAIIVAGIFPTDFKGRRESISGLIHAVFGLIILLTGSLAPLSAAILGVRKDTPGLFMAYSLLTGVALGILFILIPNGVSRELIALHRQILGETVFKFWYTYYGLHQRAFLMIYFIWLAIFAQTVLPQKQLAHPNLAEKSQKETT